MDDTPPKPGSKILEEKQRMFAEQHARAEKARPLQHRHQAHFAKALLAKLETVSPATGPSRITMTNAGILKDDALPRTAHEPERIGGCFSDIIDDTKRNEGAHEKEIETDIDTAIPGEDDEVPFG